MRRRWTRSVRVREGDRAPRERMTDGPRKMAGDLSSLGDEWPSLRDSGGFRRRPGVRWRSTRPSPPCEQTKSRVALDCRACALGTCQLRGGRDDGRSASSRRREELWRRALLRCQALRQRAPARCDTAPSARARLPRAMSAPTFVSCARAFAAADGHWVTTATRTVPRATVIATRNSEPTTGTRPPGSGPGAPASSTTNYVC